MHVGGIITPMAYEITLFKGLLLMECHYRPAILDSRMNQSKKQNRNLVLKTHKTCTALEMNSFLRRSYLEGLFGFEGFIEFGGSL
jgi:hypothetical protein